MLTRFAVVLSLAFVTVIQAATFRFSEPIGNLQFDAPTQVVAPAGHEFLYVTERAGRVIRVSRDPAPVRTVWLDLSSRVGASGFDHGLLSLAFHPKYSENGYIYLWYSVMEGGARYQRLARFTANPASATVDAGTELPLITQRTGAGGHDGGTLVFGADGYLYLSLGDGDTGFAEAAESRQCIDRSFFGAVLRLDVDAKAGSLTPNPHPSVHAGTYKVPPDNPFVGATTYQGSAVDATKVRTEFWALGLRNPFRMDFDPATGMLWCADVGLDLEEEINVITKGANYGWEYREGFSVGPSRQPVPPSAVFTDPVWSYDHDYGYSITGGVVYQGHQFPELHRGYLFSDFVSGRVWQLKDDGKRPLLNSQVMELTQEGGIVAFASDPANGDILVADFDDGCIRKLERLAVPQDDYVVNLATRGRARDDDPMIAGFVIRDQPKTVLVRAVGPSLAQFKVTSPLARPQLRLLAGDVELARAANWGADKDPTSLEAARLRAGAFELAAGTQDSALVATLAPGSYTAIVDSLDKGQGVALVEVYDADADRSNAGRLINISTRAKVSSGDGTLIPGIVIRGTTPKTLLIRAACSSLIKFGINDGLNAPKLTLFKGETELFSNSGWRSAPNAAQLWDAMTKAGAFELLPDGNDCALVVTLLPGDYTLHLMSTAGSTGTGLVEVYDLEGL